MIKPKQQIVSPNGHTQNNSSVMIQQQFICISWMHYVFVRKSNECRIKTHTQDNGKTMNVFHIAWKPKQCSTTQRETNHNLYKRVPVLGLDAITIIMRKMPHKTDTNSQQETKAKVSGKSLVDKLEFFACIHSVRMYERIKKRTTQPRTVTRTEQMVHLRFNYNTLRKSKTNATT